MTELLTAAQMRAIEQAAIDSGEVTGLELMERAGRGVVEAIFEEWPELAKTSHRAVVLCGPGNNGGDGFVVARLLKEWGWEVEVFLYGDREKLPTDAKVNCERWLEMGEIGNLSELGDDTATVALNRFHQRIWDCEPDLFIDALFGTGLTRPMPHVLQDICRDTLELTSNGVSHKEFKIVSVDIPSGICADSGSTLARPNTDRDIAVIADITVVFHRPKVGHFLNIASFGCRKIVVKDIGLPELWRSTRSLKWSEVVSLPQDRIDIDLFDLGKLRLPIGAHKYDHGHALILSGPSGHGGAARLAARGALRIGAGLVSVACPPDALAEHAAQLNAIMVRGFDGAAGLAEVLSDDRISSITLGPGLGLTDATKALVEIALKSQKNCVLDADALSIFQNNEDALFGLCHEGVVLTPHGGEFARLFPDISEKLAAPATTGPAYSKVDATREAAKRAGCVVLFKGADTVIAAPDGQCSINSAHYDRAAPWLATAGSGDVLAGFIGGLMARGFDPMQAAQTAAWLHVECARSFGPGLIAEDLPEELPKVFRALDI
jgi:ADP-dependent NAD(P)H-hydrate dehydratase / NAD(P)H-hydrate epimerase